MGYTEQELREILSKDVQVSQQVEDKLKSTYIRLGEQQTATPQPEKKKSGKRKLRTAVAIIAAVILVGGSSMLAYAAINTDIFDNMFGNSTKESLPAKQVPYRKQDQEVGKTGTVTLPSTEFVEVDMDTAQRLLGDYLMATPIVKQLDDHTLTITGLVYSPNGAVMTFTLERKGGVTMLEYDDEARVRCKGAWFSDSTHYKFDINGGDHIYMDTKQSTNEKLVCTDYVAWGEVTTKPQLRILHYQNSEEEFNAKVKEKTGIDYDGSFEGVPSQELWEQIYEIPDEITEEYLDLTDKEPVPIRNAVSKTGGSLEISPFTLRIDVSKGIDVDWMEDIDAFEPADIDFVEIRFRDGSTYMVEDREHSISNIGDCVSKSHFYHITFNRLVDVDQIREIVVNDVTYTLQ